MISSHSNSHEACSQFRNCACFIVSVGQRVTAPDPVTTELAVMNSQGSGGLSYGPFISRKQAKAQGLKWYYTGKTCKNEHIAPRQCTNCGCKECGTNNTKRWRANNPERVRELSQQHYKRSRSWIDANRETINASSRRYYERHKERLADRQREWRKEKRDSYRAIANRYKAKRNREDSYFRLSNRLRERLRSVLNRAGVAKSSKTIEMTGCTWDQLRQHFEDQFQDGMSWDNMGEWHIDHIRPCASFDLTDPVQQRQCFHYTNLQPLWASQNIRKQAKW